jgi:hypothetical protein
LGFVEIPGCHFIPRTVAGFLTEILGFVEIPGCHFIPSSNPTVAGFLTEIFGFVEIPGCHFIPSSNQTVADFLTEIFGFVEIPRCHFIPSYNQTVLGFLTEVFQYCICNHHKMNVFQHPAVIVQSFIRAVNTFEDLLLKDSPIIILMRIKKNCPLFHLQSFIRRISSYTCG